MNTSIKQAYRIVLADSFRDITEANARAESTEAMAKFVDGKVTEIRAQLAKSEAENISLRNHVDALKGCDDLASERATRIQRLEFEIKNLKAAPKPTADITPRPRAELIEAIRNEYWIAMKEHAADGAVNALTHRLFVTGTTTIRERLSRETVLAALRDAGIHPLAPESESNDEFISFEDDAALIKWARENKFQFRWFRAAPDAREKLVDESRLNIRLAMLNSPAKQAAPGAFLSADEDRELVAMGREIYNVGNSDVGFPNVVAVGSILSSGKIKMRQDGYGEEDWLDAFAPTPDNPEHLTDAARALLRRVRDERKSTPKEGTNHG